jgi:hypothetical protein
MFDNLLISLFSAPFSEDGIGEPVRCNPNRRCQGVDDFIGYPDTECSCGQQRMHVFCEPCVSQLVKVFDFPGALSAGRPNDGVGFPERVRINFEVSGTAHLVHGPFEAREDAGPDFREICHDLFPGIS